jgi:hypothetical protein
MYQHIKFTADERETQRQRCIHTGRLYDRKLKSETLNWTTSPLFTEYGIE